MDFKLNFDFDQTYHIINHKDKLLFLGSCFSDEISSKFKYHGFNSLSNPFGTIFHPIIISKFIDECLSNKTINERIFHRNDIFLSWDASSTIYDTDKFKLKLDLIEIRRNFVNQLKAAHTLFITFGSSWGYHLEENSELVANCHKMPSNIFRKELSSIESIVSEWRKTIDLIKVINPEIQLIFTVSPVRHIKDGLIENNQSKSILIESIRQINKFSNSSYFPSYEIMIDELRDYRFYKSDLIHPSEDAIEYIWNKIQTSFFELNTIKKVKDINSLKKQIGHKYLHPDSKETIENKMKLDIKIKKFKEENPEIIL